MKGSNVRNWIRGRCKICSKQVPIKCKSCEVFLCVQNASNDKKCWIRLHNCRNFVEMHTKPGVESDSEADELSEEEAVSPRVFLSGLWGITLGDSGFFFGPVTISERSSPPILLIILSPRASKENLLSSNCITLLLLLYIF